MTTARPKPTSAAATQPPPLFHGRLCPQCAQQGHQSILRDADEDADGLALCRRCGYVDQSGTGSGGGAYVKEKDWYHASGGSGGGGGGGLEQLERQLRTTNQTATSKTLRIGGRAVPGQSLVIRPSSTATETRDDDARRRAQTSFNERLDMIHLFVDNLTRHGALGDVSGESSLSREAWQLFTQLYVKKPPTKSVKRKRRYRRGREEAAASEGLEGNNHDDDDAAAEDDDVGGFVQLGDRAKVVAAACVAAVAEQIYTRRERERVRNGSMSAGSIAAGHPIDIARLEQFIVDSTGLAEDTIDLRKGQQDVLVRQRRQERSDARTRCGGGGDGQPREASGEDEDADDEDRSPILRQSVQSAVDRLCYLNEHRRKPAHSSEGKEGASSSSKDEIAEVLHAAAMNHGDDVTHLALDVIKVVKLGERAAMSDPGTTRPDRRSHAPLVAAAVLAATEFQLGRWHRHYAHVLTEISDAVGCAKHTASERYLEVIAIVQEWMEWLPTVGSVRPIPALAKRHHGTKREQALPKRHLAVLLLKDVVDHRQAILPYVRERYRRQRAGEPPLDPGDWVKHFLPQGFLPPKRIKSTASALPAPPYVPAAPTSTLPSVLAVPLPLRPPGNNAPVPISYPDLGPGWSSTLPWDDPRLPIASKALDDLLTPSKRVQVARKRKLPSVHDASIIEDPQCTSKSINSVYARVRPSDERFYRVRRRGRAIVDYLNEWKRDHDGEDAEDTAQQQHPVKCLLLSGVDASMIPLHIFPTSKLLARAILEHHGEISALDAADDDSLFEDGEMESYMCTEREKEARLRMWIKEGVHERQGGLVAIAMAEDRKTKRQKRSASPMTTMSAEDTGPDDRRAPKPTSTAARSSKVRYGNLPSAVLDQVLGNGGIMGDELEVSLSSWQCIL